MQRDFQRQRVYDWENKNVSPFDKSKVAFKHIEPIVRFVWPGKNPPRVRPLPSQTTRHVGDATRTELRFHNDKSTPTWIILHELAHALTEDAHGPNFVGVYIQLLNRYLNIPIPLLHFSARNSGVRFSVTPQYGDYS